DMKTTKYIARSFLNALGVLIYISCIAVLGFNSNHLFGAKDNVLMPIFVLLLFVISASVTGLLVLGKPVLLYVNGLKKEAITLLLSTIVWLVLFLVVVT